MDDFKSFIPSENLDALLFQHAFPTFPLPQGTTSHQDLVIADHSPAPAPPGDSGVGFNKQPMESSAAGVQTNGGKSPNDEKKMKKIVHRDVERQRRQEMASLYSSLRNLLPLQYIKAKRSTTEHVNGAVNYIKDMEKNIKEMEERRDKLRNLSVAKEVGFRSENFRKTSPPEITVRPCSCVGLEIVVCNTAEDESIPLSRLLQVLLEEGLSVVSCVSSKVDGKFVYFILTEASHMTGVDLCVLLQQTLAQRLGH